MIKYNFRILKKPHANFQTIAKAPVKFQKDWPKTVGGVEGTRYLLKIRNHAPRSTHHALRKAENSVPLLFFEKAGDNYHFASWTFVLQCTCIRNNAKTSFCRNNTRSCKHSLHLHECYILFLSRFKISKNNENVSSESNLVRKPVNVAISQLLWVRKLYLSQIPFMSIE